MFRIGFFLAGCAVLMPVEKEAARSISATSPDGRVRLELAVAGSEGEAAVPRFRVTFEGREVVGSSRVGVEMTDGSSLGGPCEVVGVEARTVREEYEQIPGKRRNVVAHASEAVVRLREATAPRRTWEVVLRAYDDGVALRYGFPKQEGWESLSIRQERTEFRFDAAARAYVLPLNGYTTSYEKRYATRHIRDLPQDWLLGLPLLVECPGGVWAAITEANVEEYAGLYLAPAGADGLAARLSPLPKDSDRAVRAALPHVSPWRVIMIGDRVGRLVESDLVLNLSTPCAIADRSWIKPGKTTFPWWNGFYEENVPFKMGLNTETARHYIDFCAEAGIPCHSLDGVGNTAWYGGPIVPYQGADITQAVPGLDLAEVLRYAKTKGVRIRLWMHWQAAQKHMERAFPLYREWGVEGVMLDFMDRDDQEMNRFVRKAVKLAAENRLTVTLHGCPKPTGLERTYPNLLTHEGVMNLEYNKWDTKGITPGHEVTVALTRMLAGPLDFHQGSFRAVPREKFKPRNEAPLVMGSATRTLASYVVFQNHMAMVADYPTAYRRHPALPILAAIPATWDETKVLDAQIGAFVVVARRSGAAWYVGAMTDANARSLDVPLAFLAPGRYSARIVSDRAADPQSVTVSEQEVSPGDVIRLELSRGGGGMAAIAPR